MVVNMHMPGNLRVVGENRVIAHLAVMRHVHVGHDPVVVADPGNARILRRTAVQRAKLAYGVVIADFKTRRFVLVFFVLRRLADGTELKEHVAGADPGMCADDHVGSYAGAGVDFRVGTNNRIRTDLDIVREAGPGIDDGRWMDARSHGLLYAGRSRTVHISSASAASASSTRATALNFQMPRTCRVRFTVIRKASPAVTGRLKRALSMPTK